MLLAHEISSLASARLLSAELPTSTRSCERSGFPSVLHLSHGTANIQRRPLYLHRLFLPSPAHARPWKAVSSLCHNESANSPDSRPFRRISEAIQTVACQPLSQYCRDFRRIAGHKAGVWNASPTGRLDQNGILAALTSWTRRTQYTDSDDRRIRSASTIQPANRDSTQHGCAKDTTASYINTDTADNWGQDSLSPQRKHPGKCTDVGRPRADVHTTTKPLRQPTY